MTPGINVRKQKGCDGARRAGALIGLAGGARGAFGLKKQDYRTWMGTVNLREYVPKTGVSRRLYPMSHVPLLAHLVLGSELAWP